MAQRRHPLHPLSPIHPSIRHFLSRFILFLYISSFFLLFTKALLSALLSAYIQTAQVNNTFKFNSFTVPLTQVRPLTAQPHTSIRHVFLALFLSRIYLNWSPLIGPDFRISTVQYFSIRFITCASLLTTRSYRFNFFS
jgi:hypothetical protein